MSRAFITAILTYLLNGLDELAKTTPTKIDDEAVDVGRAIVEEGVLLDWFFANPTAADGTMNFVAATPEVQAVLDRRKIDFGRLVEVATMLWGIYRTFAGK